MVAGRARGHLEAGYHELSNAKSTTKGGGGNIWEDNDESFKKLWGGVAEETGTIWDVKGLALEVWNHTGGVDKPKNRHRTKEQGIVPFIVTRLE